MMNVFVRVVNKRHGNASSKEGQNKNEFLELAFKSRKDAERKKIIRVKNTSGLLMQKQTYLH